jgi:CheY-like chemotaxis protein
MEKAIFMIIDDDEDDRFFFKEALEQIHKSIVCLEATDGADAIEVLHKASVLPDFIFLDMNMPRMDGRECLKELKNDVLLQKIKVVMYSTFFSEQSIAEFLDLGASTYLKKPTDLNNLLGQIKDALNRAVGII